MQHITFQTAVSQNLAAKIMFKTGHKQDTEDAAVVYDKSSIMGTAK